MSIEAAHLVDQSTRLRIFGVSHQSKNGDLQPQASLDGIPEQVAAKLASASGLVHRQPTKPCSAHGRLTRQPPGKPGRHIGQGNVIHKTLSDDASAAKSSWFLSGLTRSSSMMGFARSSGT